MGVLLAFPLRMMRLGTGFASLCLEDSHISEVALMGRGLSTVEGTSNLVALSPIVTVDGKIMSFIPWYRGFKASDFDT